MGWSAFGDLALFLYGDEITLTNSFTKFSVLGQAQHHARRCITHYYNGTCVPSVRTIAAQSRWTRRPALPQATCGGATRYSFPFKGWQFLTAPAVISVPCFPPGFQFLGSHGFIHAREVSKSDLCEDEFLDQVLCICRGLSVCRAT